MIRAISRVSAGEVLDRRFYEVYSRGHDAGLAFPLLPLQKERYIKDPITIQPVYAVESSCGVRNIRRDNGGFDVWA